MGVGVRATGLWGLHTVTTNCMKCRAKHVLMVALWESRPLRLPSEGHSDMKLDDVTCVFSEGWSLTEGMWLPAVRKFKLDDGKSERENRTENTKLPSELQLDADHFLSDT